MNAPGMVTSSVPVPEVLPLSKLVDQYAPVAILGGTGAQGRGLALRWALAGIPVIIGSRTQARAQLSADALNDLLPNESPPILGGTNSDAAAQAKIVVVAVPWAAHDETLHAVAAHVGAKLVIDCVNPLGFDAQGPKMLAVSSGSATQAAAALLPEARVTGAFHHVSALLLQDLQQRLEGDVLVVADTAEDAHIVMGLVEAIAGLRGIWAGRLRLAAAVEGLTANLIAVNKKYRAHAGISLTGVATAAEGTTQAGSS